MKVLTINEAAEASGYKPTTIRKYCVERRFSCEKRGPRFWLIDERSFLAYTRTNPVPVRGNPMWAERAAARRASLVSLLRLLPPKMRTRIAAGAIRVTIPNLTALAKCGDAATRRELFESMRRRRRTSEGRPKRGRVARRKTRQRT